ncbi:hypothetical protein Tcan_02110 [Toxocara canis]|uniref:Uncharacterized protein n=1 Tax=Toxocara canis TaxID=6265 RepID=A0A0B2URB9_TOXCA|nr:hypothetical protein Tcan_02110 [Toxocara canis]
MKPPLNARMYDAYLSPQGTLRYANANGNIQRNLENIASPCHLHSRHVYTYEEHDVVMRLNSSSERVGFSMSGGADENLETIVNSVIPG